VHKEIPNPKAIAYGNPPPSINLRIGLEEPKASEKIAKKIEGDIMCRYNSSLKIPGYALEFCRFLSLFSHELVSKVLLQLSSYCEV